MNLLVTGSSGFVGRPACLTLSRSGFNVTALTRSSVEWPSSIRSIISSSLVESLHSDRIFEGIDCVLHLAGRAHVLRDRDPDPLGSFRNVNVYQTLQFARSAALSGVRRFVYVSSIKVNGESTDGLSPFTINDEPSPVDSYAISKFEAELAPFNLSCDTGMELVVVRPPLIYGPGAKGNFKLLLRLLQMKVPIPLGSITDNKRSFISLDNFIDFLGICVVHAGAAGRLFLVSDQHDVSTVELLESLGSALNAPTRLLDIPRSFLETTSRLINMQTLYQRLCGSLLIDSSAASRILDWSPLISFEEGIRRSVNT